MKYLPIGVVVNKEKAGSREEAFSKSKPENTIDLFYPDPEAHAAFVARIKRSFAVPEND